MSMCTNEKLIEFGLDHYTFINQIFGDEGIRGVIANIWKANKGRYKLVDEPADLSAFPSGGEHHVIYLKNKTGKFSKKKVWCSVEGCEVVGEELAPCYQDTTRDENDTLCQSYTLLKYLGYELPLGRTPEARIQLQMNMVAMYRMIISNENFYNALDTFEIPSWKDCRGIPEDQDCAKVAAPLYMDKPELLYNISRVLDEWKAYGYHYFIGDGTCPSEDLEHEEESPGAAAAAVVVPVAARTRRGVEPVAARRRSIKRTFDDMFTSGGKKLKKNKKKSKRKSSTKRKRSPTRRSKRLQNKQKNKQTNKIK